MALITVAQVQARADAKGIDLDAWEDTEITAIITSAQKYIEKITGCIFDEQTFTETWSGAIHNLISTLHTVHFPVTSVTSLVVDGVTKQKNSDYYLTDADIGTVSCDFYLPTTGYNNIALEYKAGYNPAHPTVADICMELVLDTIESDPTGEKVLKYSDADFIIQYGENTNLMERLEPFKRPFMSIVRG